MNALFFIVPALILLVVLIYRNADRYEKNNKKLYDDFKIYCKKRSHLRGVLFRVSNIEFDEWGYSELFYMELGDEGRKFNLWREMR